MDLRRRVLANRRIAAAISVAVVVPMILACHGGNSSPSRDQTSAAMSTRASEETAIRAVVTRFINAYNTGNRSELYAVQSDAYKAVCSREQFDAIPLAPSGSQLSGPGDVQIQGSLAVASVITAAAGSNPTTNQLPLERAVDGSWRIQAPSKTGCVP